jgi:hypothetical protein
MPDHHARNVRNLAAFLLMLSGISHVAQLWFRETDATALFTALVGMVYLVLALGLSGQSRFALWATGVTLVTDGVNSVLWSPKAANPLIMWHIAIDGIVAVLCVYILYRTRFADMD